MKITQKSLQNKNYCWHGNPVAVEFGNCVVRENLDKPLWWTNFECRGDHNPGMKTLAVVEAIKVTQDGYSFVINNSFGIGVAKLLKGGWPNHTHASLPIDSFEAHSEEDLEMRIPFILEFDEEAWAAHEAARDRWQKVNYPEEHKKMQGLRDMLLKGNPFTK